MNQFNKSREYLATLQEAVEKLYDTHLELRVDDPYVEEPERDEKYSTISRQFGKITTLIEFLNREVNMMERVEQEVRASKKLTV